MTRPFLRVSRLLVPSFWSRVNAPASIQSRAEPTAVGGYDAALADEPSDLLGRRHVARRVHRLLTGTPAGWSVRVGLLGGWGEGKTTVAKWAKAAAELDGHLVAWFSPTASATASELWTGLAEAVLEAADDQKMPPEATTKLRMFVAGRNTAKRLGAVAQAYKAGQAMQAAADNFLRIGPGHLTELRKALGEGRRVVVVIDDLDRADPKLLPGLLLALRDVLDLPGFSFLLPFDERVVAEALQAYNAAWGDGRRFLDKILDFRVTLAPSDLVERRRIFEAAAASACPFLPSGVVAGMEALLPENPRRLKALARGLSLLAEEADRHRPDEIDWRSIVYGSLVREESEAFFRAYVEDTFNAKGKGDLPLDRLLFQMMDKETGPKTEAERVGALLARHVADEPVRQERLRELCGAWLDDAGIGNGSKVYYAMLLMDAASSGTTWADYDAVLELCRSGRGVEAVAAWVEGQARTRSILSGELGSALIQALCVGYARGLELAADALLVSEHEATLAEAGVTRALLGDVARLGLPGLPPNAAQAIAFPALFAAVVRWAHFRRNPADAAARADEAAMLCSWADQAGPRRQAYMAVFGDEEDGPFDHIRSARKVLRNELLGRLSPPAGNEELALLDTPGGVESARRRGGSPQARTVLLDPAGPLWTPPGSSPGETLLAQAAARPEVQKNARELLGLAWLANKGEVALQDDKVSGAFLGSPVLAVAWAAATATPLQFRALSSLRDLRADLVRRGASEAALPAPDWLAEA